MMIASKGFARSRSAVFTATLFFIYPSFVFLLLKALNVSFYGTNPLSWAISIFVVGTLVSIIYRLPQLLGNLYRGIPNYGYHIQGNKVYFNGERIHGADAATFVYYDDRAYYSREASHTYLAPTAHIDIPHEYYSKDKNQVYYRTKKLADTDAATFGPLANDDSQTYWHDKKHAYYKWTRIPEADGASFRYLGHRYAADKEYVFLEDKRLPGAVVSTFKPMGGFVGKDAHRVFVQALPVENVKDVAGFETELQGADWFGRDRTHVYFICYNPANPLLVFPGADLKTFEVLGERYAKDKDRVYFYSGYTASITVLEDANAATFRLHFDAEKNTDATDGANYYQNGILYK
jgi:hypothetical protein